ncbi:hypothetical protein P7K49_019482 [Saguinus oedipus]|uniref:Uncharacterized protein n=1 Tax=Saguinus oedipus TaxID=9490 RepID=A0ABQ9UXH3_SAGOE|nr:hypothetical protein P7K49_019482 [Saguinus oedipus]
MCVLPSLVSTCGLLSRHASVYLRMSPVLLLESAQHWLSVGHFWETFMAALMDPPGFSSCDLGRASPSAPSSPLNAWFQASRSVDPSRKKLLDLRWYHHMNSEQQALRKTEKGTCDILKRHDKFLKQESSCREEEEKGVKDAGGEINGYAAEIALKTLYTFHEILQLLLNIYGTRYVLKENSFRIKPNISLWKTHFAFSLSPLTHSVLSIFVLTRRITVPEQRRGGNHHICPVRPLQRVKTLTSIPCISQLLLQLGLDFEVSKCQLRIATSVALGLLQISLEKQPLQALLKSVGFAEDFWETNMYLALPCAVSRILSATVRFLMKSSFLLSGKTTTQKVSTVIVQQLLLQKLPSTLFIYYNWESGG